MTDVLPERDEVDATIKVVTDHADRIFLWDYTRGRDQLVTLYNKAMSSQWNSMTDLDWATDVDPVRLVETMPNQGMVVGLARQAKELPGSPLANWSEKEFTALGVEMLKAQLSQFVHGEQGAMMVAAKIVETVPWIDAKYYAATQTMDEARHTEVFAKYLETKLGDFYPMSPPLEAQVTDLIEDSRWDIAYLGMQIVIESLALAAFGSMLRSVEEPLLKKLLRYVMSDEARHVAFGVLSLSEYYQELSAAELRERQEFLADNTLRSKARSAFPEMWERLGVDFHATAPFLMEAAKADKAKGGGMYGSFFKGFYAKLVPNTRKLGLLDANDGYLRGLWADSGMLAYEHADDTASDFEAYDEVAKDRAAVTDPAGTERSTRVTAGDRRTGLLACAADLLDEGGAPAVTMDAVATRARVSRTLVYKHFANRDELLAALWRREAAAVDRAVSEALVDVDDFESIVRISLEAVIDAVKRHGSLGIPLLQGELFGPEVKQEQQARRRRVRAWYVDRVIDGFGLARAEADIATSIFIAGLDSMLADWRADPHRVDQQTLVDTYVRLVVGGLHGIAARP